MSRDILNLKLETFFDHLNIKNGLGKNASNDKMSKEASVGNFNDVLTEEDVAKNAKMVSEMLALPKYQEIKQKLQNANGVVNFITDDEYAPLVELLIKHCFPPNNNDVYNMGRETLSDDYFVDAKTFFGGITGGTQGNPPDQENARYQLSELLLGSRTKMSDKWAREAGMTLEEVEREIEGIELDQNRQEMADLGAEDEEVPSLAEQIRAYEADVAKLDGLKGRLAEIGREIKTNKTSEKPFSDEKIEEMKLQFKRLRGLYGRLKSAVDRQGRGLIVPDYFSGEAERDRDGFIHFDPLDEITAVGKELVKSVTGNQGDPAISKNLFNYKEKLEGYQTTDPILNKKREDIIGFLGDLEQETSVDNIINNLGTYGKMQHDFNLRARNHGKVMLFKNFENSVLCTPDTRAEDGGYVLKDKGILRDFIAANSANLSKDMSGTPALSKGKGKRGKRTMVVITSKPVAGLPASIKVDMGKINVDSEEAEIIVRNLLEQYEQLSLKVSRMNLLSGIDSKYQQLRMDAKTNAQRGKLDQDRRTELQGVKGILTKMENLGSVNGDTETQMARSIMGLGQKDAINSVLNSLATCTQTQEDENGQMISFGIEAANVLPVLTEEVNNLTSENTYGLKIRRPKVEFDRYVYREVSAWGEKVGDVGVIARECAHLKESIKDAYQQIRDIDAQLLDANLSNETKQDLQKLREKYYKEIKFEQGERANLMKMVPHFTVLWGKAGTGKSVWADALGSLFDFSIKEVDIGATRNKWVGDSEQRIRQLIDSIFEGRDMVYLIDEVDRQLTMGHGSQGEGGGGMGHSVEKDAVSQMLGAFEDRKEELQENNIFVIMTTNHLDSIDTALLSRSQGNTFEVPAAEDAEDFLRFLNSFIETEYQRNPMNPPFWKKGDETVEQKWESTREILATIDLEALAQKLGDRPLSFRTVEGLMRRAFDSHTAYLMQLRAIERGESKELRGLPLTTANMISSIELSNEAENSNADYKVGVGDVQAQVLKGAREAMSGLELQEVKKVNPRTGEEYKAYELPAEVLEIMNGTVKTEEMAPQFQVVEEPVVDEQTGESRTQMTFKPKSMDELVDDGFVEEELSPQKQQPQQPQPEETKEEEEVTSSCDYLYNFLKSSGVISEDGKLVDKKITQEQAGNEVEEVEEVSKELNYKEYNSMDNLAKRGVMYFGGIGGGLVAPSKFQ